jgi:hypothetical protein
MGIGVVESENAVHVSWPRTRQARTLWVILG